MNNLKKTILIYLTVIIYNTNYAQKSTSDNATENFKNGNYIEALKNFEKLLEREPENPEYNYKAGISELLLGQSTLSAISYLKIASNKKVDPDVDFYLAKAYHLNLKLTEALEYFQKYKNSGQGKKQAEVDREIETVNNAIKSIQYPLNVSFENLGDKINTEYPDYYPFVTPDEYFLVFTSRRKGGMKEFDGHYSSDIYYSKVSSGEFVKAKKIGTAVNTDFDEQAVGLSHNANKLFIYMDDIKNFGDIYEVDIKEFRFSKKIKMGENVNSKGFESAATISADGNTLFFASRRDGGFGGKDLYMTKKLPNGNWALPQNLGKTINTPYDEDFPNLFYDGSTLYFSSKGHNSIGGYDYFKSNWDVANNTWSKPQNIGYPINTPADNIGISFTRDKKQAYISQWRKDSKGFQDIYKVTFNELNIPQTILKSRIVKEGSTIPITDALIIVTDNETQNEIGNYIPNQRNGDFIIPLAPGNYNIMIDAPGFPPKIEDIIIKGKSDFIPFMTKEFVISP